MDEAITTTTAEAPTTSTTTVVTPKNGNGKQRRDFLVVVAACLVGCILMQGFLLWSLLDAQPPDSSWQLIKDVMTSIGTIETALVGGLLGMARSTSH